MMGIQERKEREKEHRREEILTAAQEVFFQKGLQTATMDEIAESAELSKGTLYLYYSSKEDLYLGVMMRGLDMLHEVLEETIAKAPTTMDAIWDLGTAYFDFFQKQKSFFRTFHFFQNPSIHKQVSEEMSAQCNERTQAIWKTVIDIFRRAIDEKLLREDLSPVEYAVILWSNFNALLLRIDNECDRWKDRLNVDLVSVLFKSNALLLHAMMTEEAQEQYSNRFATASIPQLT
jgi:AcrR family transcriptional regulator